MRTGHIPSSLSVRPPSRRRRACFFLSLISLASMFFFSSCNGNGGGSDSQGPTYSPGLSSGGGTGSQQGGGLSSWDIKDLANGGHTDEIVARLTGGGEDDGYVSTFTVSFSAEDLRLPAGGWLTLEISGGDDDYKKSARAYPDGNVYFTIPKLPIGTIVTVTLSAYDADGTPYSSGYISKRIQKDEENYINVPLTNLPPLPTIAYGGNGSLNGNSADKDGSSYTVIEYTGESLSMTVTNSDPDSLLEVELNGTACSASETLPDGFNTITATVTKSPALPSVVSTRRVYVVKALTEPDITSNGTHYSAEDSGGYEVWKYSYLAASDYSNLLFTVTNTYTGDNAATGGHSTMTVSGLTGGPYTDGSEVSRKVVPDGDSSITITVSKDYCTDVTVTKYIKAMIKPVSFSSHGMTMWTSWTDVGGSCEFEGRISINGVDCGWHSKENVPEGGSGWSGEFGYSGTNAAFTLRSKSDTETISFTGWKETDTTGSNDVSDTAQSFSLATLRGYWETGGYGYLEIGGTVKWKVKFSLAD